MNKKIIIVALVVIVTSFLAWMYFKPGKTATPQSTNQTVTTADINISNFSFSPSSFTAKPGQKVTVLNNDSTQHSLTADNGVFDTGLISTGQVGSFTAPVTPGTYTFHCSIHKTMTGTLIVQ
jgi:plastocyanin